MQPELWDPVTGIMHEISDFKDFGEAISLTLTFDEAQSFFVVFRGKIHKRRKNTFFNFPTLKVLRFIEGPWQVLFDPSWGGPADPVLFEKLEDWVNRPEPGIKYYSGTSVYRSTFDLPEKINMNRKSDLFLDLGTVRDVARIKINGKDLGVIWTAPWRMKIPVKILYKSRNSLEIEITNTWVNRLVGDEQEPPDAEWAAAHYGPETGTYLKEFPDWFVRNLPRPSKNRYCFTTWNYFSKDSPLKSSGLIGPVSLKIINDK